jgi:hypothetical protein
MTDTIKIHTTESLGCLFMPMAHPITPEQFDNWIDESEFDPIAKIVGVQSLTAATSFMNFSAISTGMNAFLSPLSFFDSMTISLMIFCLLRFSLHAKIMSSKREYELLYLIFSLPIDCSMGAMSLLHLPWLVDNVFGLTYFQNVFLFYIPLLISSFMVNSIYGMLVVSVSYLTFLHITEVEKENDKYEDDDKPGQLNIWAGRLRKSKVEYL